MLTKIHVFKCEEILIVSSACEVLLEWKIAFEVLTARDDLFVVVFFMMKITC